MISSQEIADGLKGAWLLANRDVGGYRCFNQTVEGFWRSFAAIALVAPLYLYAVAAETALDPAAATREAPDTFAYYMAKLFALLLEWALFLVAMVFVTRLLGLTARYVPFVIAYNWSSVLIMAAFVPPVLLLQLGVIGENGLIVLSLAVTLIALYYRWFVARTALETTGMIAAALVAADVVLSLFVAGLFG